MHRVFLVACALSLPATVVHAQGVLARATQRVAAVTADLALARAVTVDLAEGGPAQAVLGPLRVSVAAVDVVNGSVVRVHVALFNGADTAVTHVLPPDSAYVLLDGGGRRFTLASVRSKAGKAGTSITVPALERVTVDAVFLLNNSTAAEAVLKVGPGVVLRGIPIRNAAPAPAAPDSTSPAP